MSSQILQPTRALEVIPSDDVEIPFPQKIEEGGSVFDSFHPMWLVAPDADFVSSGVQCGDVVYMMTSDLSQKAAMRVEKILSSTEIEMSGNAIPDGNYVIYKGGLNNGCILYIGGSGGLNIVTQGGQQLQFKEVIPGFMPIQVLSVLSEGTNCSGIVAFW